MNRQNHPNHFARRMQIMIVLLAGMVGIPAAQSQTPARTVENRYLLIFNTSSAMKKRLPETQGAVNRLFLSMMNGQLQPNDSIGVWAFDRKLRAGQFPLQRWSSGNAATIASNITTFIQREHYSQSTHFDAIMPSLNDLVENSDRLTVLIFCDGNEKIQGTPFDNAINSIFKENEHAFEKAKQAFIVILRTQLGEYVGYTVNSSAIGVNFPEFPPLPQPPQPAVSAKINPPPPPRPVITGPPLVIVGTNVGTNLASLLTFRPPPTNPPQTTMASNPPPPVVPPSIVLAIPTNVAPIKTTRSPTNSQAKSVENSKPGNGGALTMAMALMAAAGALTILMLRRSRKINHGSVITRSMKKD
jgi:hypothetical protein